MLIGGGYTDGLNGMTADDVNGFVSLLIGGTGPVPTGDINGDGFVDLGDLPPYVAVLLGMPQGPVHADRADLDNDGHANGADTQFFVEALLAE